MSFHLRKGHRAARELRRVADEEVNFALMHLRGGDVHQTRRTIKQLRALFHLAGDSIGKEISQQFRDTAHLLSETRDLEVCIKTLEQMTHSVGAAEPDVYTSARGALGKFRPLSQKKQKAALAEIIATHSRLGGWKPRTTWKEIRKTVRKSYENAQESLKAIRQAEQSASPSDIAEPFHELRKQIKRLWAQLRLVHRQNPRIIGKLIREADRVAELLGAEHDLAVLQSRLEAAHVTIPEDLSARQDEYQQASLGLAQRFLERKPGKFVKECFGS